jgi:putative oxidoreductase
VNTATESTAPTATPATADVSVDTALLILRVGVGAAMLQAGLRKALDFSTTTGFMEAGGWRLPELAAFMVTASETLGGFALILGVLTQLAAFAVLAAMIDAWAVNVSGAAFWSDPFNAPFMIGLGAVALLFAGAGAYSLDAKLPGRTVWPVRIAVGLLVAAFVVAIVTWIALNGTNPIHLTTPTG